MPSAVLAVMAVSMTVLCEPSAAASDAATVTSPPALTVPGVEEVKSIQAAAAVLTLFEVSTTPAEIPSVDEPGTMTPLSTASASPSVPTVASSVAACVAVTVMSPATFRTTSRIHACASDGVCAPSNADEISGSPSNASMALNKMLEGFQPIELNAAIPPPATSKASICEVAEATRVEVFSADTATEPPCQLGAFDPGLGRRQHDVRHDQTADARPGGDVAVVGGEQRGGIGGGHHDGSTHVKRRVDDRGPHLAAQVVVVDQRRSSCRRHRPTRRR